MYKKIKNSSFMNIFWFILYLLPLVMIIVYSINFYRNDEITINTEDLTYHFDNVSWYNYFDIYSYQDENFLLYNNVDNYWFNNSEFTRNDGYIIFDLSQLDNYWFNKYLYIISDGDVNNSIVSTNWDGDSSTSDGYSSLLNFNYYFIDLSYIYSYDESDSFIQIYFSLKNNSSYKFYFLLTDNFIFSPSQLYEFYYKDNTNNNSFDIILSSSSDSDYATYLQDNFYNTFSHNGLIYNMFINLFSYFGVLNIYIKIISVYLEYIILISLIHLAVDILLLLPNICHKFMEKVGGERD